MESPGKLIQTLFPTVLPHVSPGEGNKKCGLQSASMCAAVNRPQTDAIVKRICRRETIIAPHRMTWRLKRLATDSPIGLPQPLSIQWATTAHLTGNRPTKL